MGSAAFVRRVLRPLVLLLTVAGCARGAPTSRVPEPDLSTTADFTAVRRQAASEIIESGGLRVADLALGSARVGTDTFAATLTNRTQRPLLVELDLRTTPGLWLRRNWQSHWTFALAPSERRAVSVSYQLLALSPEGALRVRLTGPDSTGGTGQLLFERRYALGGGNPDAYDPRQGKQVLRTAHLELWAATGSPAARDLPRIAATRERAVQRIGSLLDVVPPARIRLVFFPDSASKTGETHHVGMGAAFDSTLVEIYNDSARLDPFHELAHLVAERLGTPPALLSEGFATYVAERLGARALAYNSDFDTTVDSAACALGRERRLIAIDSLLKFNEIGSDESQPKVAYPESASFVKYLVESYGLPTFRNAYRTLQATDDAQWQANNVVAFAHIFGVTPAVAELAWRRRLACGVAG